MADITNEQSGALEPNQKNRKIVLIFIKKFGKFFFKNSRN